MNGSMTWKKYPLTRFALLIIPIAILAVVSGCGGAKSIQQSVVVRDTVVVTKERVLHDTLTIRKDTILFQDRVRVEVKYLPGEKMIVEAECPSDTVKVQTIKIVNQPIIEKKKKWSWQGLVGWAIAILCILIIVRELVKGLARKLF